MRIRLHSKPWMVAALAATSIPHALHAQTEALTIVSAASYSPIVAPGSLASAWGTGLASATVAAGTNGQPVTNLPSTLGGVQLLFTDAAKTQGNLGLLMVSASQINFQVPTNAELGKGTVRLDSASGAKTGTALISNVSPGIFTANGTGTGVAAAQVQRVSGGQTVGIEDAFQLGNAEFSPRTIRLTSANQAYLILYGTGIRRKSLNPAYAMIGDTAVPVLFAGAQNQFPGLDQVNIGPLPISLSGRGTLNLTVVVDGIPSNAVTVGF